MEAMKSSFLPPAPPLPTKFDSRKRKKANHKLTITSVTSPDPWSLSTGNRNKPKPISKNPKSPLSDDNARRIIKAKAKYLSELRRNQWSRVQTPKWIQRTPEQMVQYLEDDRNGHLYGKHVVAAIRTVRSVSGLAEGSYDMRQVMGSFVAKLSFREMCVVLKEQKSWRQARDFFDWMKLQLCYHPNVMAYTIMLRIYGQVGKIKLAEQIFLEMLEAGCEPDEVACGTMICTYARWGRHKAMLSFFAAMQERGITQTVAVFNFMLSSLQKKSLHEKVIDIWRRMVEMQVFPNSFTYTVVISSLVKAGFVEEAFNTFNDMRQAGCVPEEVTYSSLINLHCKLGRQHEAIELYEDMRTRGIVPSNFTCASLLNLYHKNGNYSRAMSLFSEMERHKIKADEVIYGLLIRIYGKLGFFEDAQKTFDEIQQLGLLTDEKTYVAMAQVHLNSGKSDKALKTMQLMRSRNIRFSKFSYNVLLLCYVMEEDVVSAENIYGALCETGTPDAISSSIMLNLYVKLDLTKKAKEFILQLRRIGVQMDDELCKAIMKVYCYQGMIRDAEQLIEELNGNRSFKDSAFIHTCVVVKNRLFRGSREVEEVMTELDIKALEMMLEMYAVSEDDNVKEEIIKIVVDATSGFSIVNQLIRRLIREGNMSKAEVICDQLIKLNYTTECAEIAPVISSSKNQKSLPAAPESSLTSRSWSNMVIDVYAKCGKPHKAYQLYQTLTGKGHDLGAVAVSIVVNALSNCGNHQEAQNVIHQSLNNCGELDTVAYNTFIKASLKAGKLHYAATIYEHMISMEVRPSIQTYSTMISVYGRGKKLDKAEAIFDLARGMGALLDEKAYMTMISYYGKAGKSQEASRLFAQMSAEGIKIGRVSYNIMMSVYATSGFYHEAEELLQAMWNDGCKPDSCTYLALIQAYIKSSKLLEAEKTMISMQKLGISPSCVHYNCLLNALSNSGLLEDAERIFQDMLVSGLSPDLESHRALLRGYLDYGHIVKGIRFFEKVYESIERDRFIMSAAVKLYNFFGEECKAKGVLSSMNDLGIPFLQNLEVGSKGKKS